ncbi:multicopper oxidase family protein [Streptomyces atratus]|uniref:Multicopper oxidase with three cupredoxin domains (Includes cell division protein FtsP and spore coat protein CotA) n=1 Tax=Streptomyces atratus TaxID=1893 RepID=A0A1K1UAJ6_STRAR|nr:multicopper oxidase family protein [Streptomyces atratus]SFX09419.1 Multicopper oxidase with three cupredoxin domains (includes cell division protein FtsP and spore coat protein CotA) [Streptomyces atratus]
MRTPPTRRAVLGAAFATAGSAVLAACSDESETGHGGKKTGSANAGDTSHGSVNHGTSPRRKSDGEYVSPDGKEVAAAEAKRGSGPVRRVDLVATPSRLDLGGGLTVGSWAYDARLPGKELRVTMGDTLALTLANRLPAETTLHWHGLNVRNDMDGVPDLTQAPIKPGAEFAYRFKVPHAGTYWFHPHTGVQQDRGLYAPLIVEDPKEPLKYDKEWVVVLDDWVDGVDGSTPDSVLYELSKGRGGMDHGGGSHGAPAKPSKGRTGPSRLEKDSFSELLNSHGGDVAYPYYLINGRAAKSPTSFAAKPGDRIRLRIINAGGDTAFRVALGGHRMTITHTDGYPVRHRTTDALLLGMGERYDVMVTAGDGVFPLTALAEGKRASALALLRTGMGKAPTASVRPEELYGELVEAYELMPDRSVELSSRKPDRTIRFRMTGSMKAYDWAFDHEPYNPHQRHPVRAGERVRLEFFNVTEMWHPIHLHGHSFGLVGPVGPSHRATRRGRAHWAHKDTAIIRPNSSLAVEFDADNPGLWMLHCHNIYHSDVGMMTVLGYRR